MKPIDEIVSIISARYGVEVSSTIRRLILKAIGDVEQLRAEVEMLRGVGCQEDGDGPCGVCIKCALSGWHTSQFTPPTLDRVHGEILDVLTQEFPDVEARKGPSFVDRIVRLVQKDRVRADRERVALWAHCVSEHAAILPPDSSLKTLAEYHRDEHQGPGTIRNHDPASRTYSLKKLGQVLSEADE